MKFVSEYRSAALIDPLVKKIHERVSGSMRPEPWVLMEICGGQTHSIMKYALDKLLPAKIQLVHGPGCPVCVTPAEVIDRAITLAQLPKVILCSYGDMLRVPGSQTSLQNAKSMGADVRFLYSPLDALPIAQENPGKNIVFFAVGFETTAPATALTLVNAKRLGIDNIFVLLAHFLVPPALSAIAAMDNTQDNTQNQTRVQGFLAPGHVCAVSGTKDYAALASRYHLPIVITGFEPADILLGIYHCVDQLERGEGYIDNQYTRAVNSQGNLQAQKIVNEVFTLRDQQWRGMGIIAKSGLQLKDAYKMFDANLLAPAQEFIATEQKCQSGDILRGQLKPNECPHFGTSCKPEHPLGAPMVSTEGACAAYFNYLPPMQ